MPGCTCSCTIGATSRIHTLPYAVTASELLSQKSDLLRLNAFVTCSVFSVASIHSSSRCTPSHLRCSLGSQSSIFMHFASGPQKHLKKKKLLFNALTELKRHYCCLKRKKNCIFCQLTNGWRLRRLLLTVLRDSHFYSEACFFSFLLISEVKSNVWLR